jgi:hypothetical protein
VNKRARAKWVNVYEKADGSRSMSLPQPTRNSAERQAFYNTQFNKRRLLYRLRVRCYLEPRA